MNSTEEVKIEEEVEKKKVDPKIQLHNYIVLTVYRVSLYLKIMKSNTKIEKAIAKNYSIGTESIINAPVGTMSSMESIKKRLYETTTISNHSKILDEVKIYLENDYTQNSVLSERIQDKLFSINALSTIIKCSLERAKKMVEVSAGHINDLIRISKNTKQKKIKFKPMEKTCICYLEDLVKPIKQSIPIDIWGVLEKNHFLNDIDNLELVGLVPSNHFNKKVKSLSNINYLISWKGTNAYSMEQIISNIIKRLKKITKNSFKLLNTVVISNKFSFVYCVFKFNQQKYIIKFNICSPDIFPFKLFYLTGPKYHVEHVLAYAKRHEFHLTENGITKNKEKIEINTHFYNDKHIYQILGLKFIEPEYRFETHELVPIKKKKRKRKSKKRRMKEKKARLKSISTN
jgi:DNA polymerase/3'-5' exonuclease PolX